MLDHIYKPIQRIPRIVTSEPLIKFFSQPLCFHMSGIRQWLYGPIYLAPVFSKTQDTRSKLMYKRKLSTDLRSKLLYSLLEQIACLNPVEEYQTQGVPWLFIDRLFSHQTSLMLVRRRLWLQKPAFIFPKPPEYTFNPPEAQRGDCAFEKFLHRIQKDESHSHKGLGSNNSTLKTRGCTDFYWLPTSAAQTLARELVRSTLAALFEPTFSAYTYWTKTGCSSHLALWDLQRRFKYSKRFLVITLVPQLQTPIYYEHFLQMIRTITPLNNAVTTWLHNELKVGYLSPSLLQRQLDNSIPLQPLTALLLNLYFAQVDRWLTAYPKHVERSPFNVVSTNYWFNLKKLCRLMVRKAWCFFLLHKFYRKLTTYYFCTPLRQLTWMRFGNQVLLGVSGSKSSALKLKNALFTFLQNKGLDSSRTNQKQELRSFQNQIEFLEHQIRVGSRVWANPIQKKEMAKNSLTPLVGQMCTPPQSQSIVLYAAIPKLFKRLHAASYCITADGRIKPTRVGHLIYYPEPLLVLHFKVLSSAVCSYYAGTVNFSHLRTQLAYLFRHSCAKTLGGKLRLRSRRKVFTRFGANLTISSPTGEPLVSFLRTDLNVLTPGFCAAAVPRILKSGSKNAQPLAAVPNGLVRSLKRCIFCRTDENILCYTVTKPLIPSINDMKFRQTISATAALTEALIQWKHSSLNLCIDCYKRVRHLQFTWLKPHIYDP